MASAVGSTPLPSLSLGVGGSPSALSTSPMNGVGTGSNQQNQQSDNVSLTQGEMIGGIIGVGAAAVALGGGGTYLAMRCKKPTAAGSATALIVPPAPPAGAPATIVQRTSVTIDNRIRGTKSDGTIAELTQVALPHYAHGAPPPAGTNPFSVGVQRFHPEQSGPNCAVDMLNMLVNGSPWLMSSFSDYELMKDGYDVNGTAPKKSGILGLGTTPGPLAKVSKDLKYSGTSTAPEDFPAMYRQNFVVAKQTAHLAANQSKLTAKTQAEKNAIEKNLQKHLAFIRTVENNVGTLHRHTYENDKTDNHLTLEKAFSEYEKRSEKLQYAKVIGIAVPMKEKILGSLQDHYRFKHHYFTIEQLPDRSWIKRDSSRSDVITIKHMKNGKNVAVTDAFSAVQALFGGHAQNGTGPAEAHSSITDRTKPFHVFIPSPR